MYKWLLSQQQICVTLDPVILTHVPTMVDVALTSTVLEVTSVCAQHPTQEEIVLKMSMSVL